MDSVKERLIKNLDLTLNELRGYDIASLMPLLYVMVAHHEGHRLSIISNNETNIFDLSNRHIQSVVAIDECESELLQEIHNCVAPSYFEGRAADIVFRFYDFYCTIDQDYFQDVIEHIIFYYTSRGAKYDGMGITPKEVACLMAGIIKKMKPRGVYDPCAGLCAYAIQPELNDCAFIGQEIDSITKVIADVRLYAANKKAVLFNENCGMYWRDSKEYDVLASELPIGVRMDENLCKKELPIILEDYAIYKFMKSPSLKKAVLLVSIGTCYRKNNIDIRKTIGDNNWIDCVIKLPFGILPYTGVRTAIIVLNKERNTKDIKFVSVEDCINNDGKRRTLDYQQVLDRLTSSDNEQVATVDLDALIEHEYSFDPSTYVQVKFDLLPGQKLVKFTDYIEPVRTCHQIEETRGRMLQPEHMFGSITEMHTREISIAEDDLPASCYKICDKCVIFNVRADKFFIKNDNEPLYVSKSYSCFIVNDKKCFPEYLVDCVVNATMFRESALQGVALQRMNWGNLLLPFFEDLESQRQIVQRIYREEQRVLKQKLDRLQVLSGKSSDLIHNLGITFTKISAGIGKLREQMDGETVQWLDDNVKFALRQINSTGTDFKFAHPEMEKLKLLDALNMYIKAWGNFGYKTFEILPIKMEMSKDTKVMLDVNLFYTLLDCIFINAHQHGFGNRENQDNNVLIEVEGVVYQEEKYARIGISNNGKPLPASFTLNDFVQRGVVGINSSQDGIGGDHVYKIVKHHGGFVSIDSNSDWLTFNILFPVYLTSNETKFNDYECECI